MVEAVVKEEASGEVAEVASVEVEEEVVVGAKKARRTHITSAT